MGLEVDKNDLVESLSSLLNELNRGGSEIDRDIGTTIIETETTTTTLESTLLLSNNEDTTVQCTINTRPANSESIPSNKDTFKFDKKGEENTPFLAKRIYTAINYIVDTLTNDKLKKIFTGTNSTNITLSS